MFQIHWQVLFHADPAAGHLFTNTGELNAAAMCLNEKMSEFIGRQYAAMSR